MIDNPRLAFVASGDRAGLRWPRVLGLFRRAGPRTHARDAGQGFCQGRSPPRVGWLDRVYPRRRDRRQPLFGRLHADGSFVAEHVPVGVNLVRLVNAPLSSPSVKQVFGAYLLTDSPYHPRPADRADRDRRRCRSDPFQDRPSGRQRSGCHRDREKCDEPARSGGGESIDASHRNRAPE